jgi:enoyl-CoA hydratase/carnithine racemase
VHASDDLLPAAYALAHRFTDSRSAASTALMRQMTYRNSAEQHPLAAHRIESLAMFYTSIGDGKEGVRAFNEKRPPQFTASAADAVPGWAPWNDSL